MLLAGAREVRDVSSAVDLPLLLGCALLLGAVVAVRLASRTGLPSLLVYLALGLVVGAAGHGVHFQDYRLTADLGLVALAVILAEGGLTTRWSSLRPVLAFSTVLSTVGVAISVAVVATVAHLLLGADVRLALVLGGVVASTDAAAVFSVLRRVPLSRRVRAVLEAESGLNDAPVVALVVLASSSAWDTTSPLAGVALVAYELVSGAALGLVVGLLGAALLSRVALGSAGLYPLATLGLALGAYSGAALLHSSGFLAVYVCGVTLGRSRLPHSRAVLGFAESLALLCEAGLFVLLGLLASPARLPGAVPAALLVGASATLLARPLAVVVSALPFRLPWREQAFLSWAGLRGAVPIVLATVPVTQGLAGADRVLDVVFVLVVVYSLVQAPTLPYVGRRLGLVDAGQARAVDIETAPLEQLRADLLTVSVSVGSRLQGVYVSELRLPAGAHVVLVQRAGSGIVPDVHTDLRTGDEVLVVTPVGAREATEARLRAVALGGRLARWYGESGR